MSKVSYAVCPQCDRVRSVALHGGVREYSIPSAVDHEKKDITEDDVMVTALRTVSVIETFLEGHGQRNRVLHFRKRVQPLTAGQDARGTTASRRRIQSLQSAVIALEALAEQYTLITKDNQQLMQNVGELKQQAAAVAEFVRRTEHDLEAYQAQKAEMQSLRERTQQAESDAERLRVDLRAALRARLELERDAERSAAALSAAASPPIKQRAPETHTVDFAAQEALKEIATLRQEVQGLKSKRRLARETIEQLVTQAVEFRDQQQRSVTESQMLRRALVASETRHTEERARLHERMSKLTESKVAQLCERADEAVVVMDRAKATLSLAQSVEVGSSKPLPARVLQQAQHKLPPAQTQIVQGAPQHGSTQLAPVTASGSVASATSQLSQRESKRIAASASEGDAVGVEDQHERHAFETSAETEQAGWRVDYEFRSAAERDRVKVTAETRARARASARAYARALARAVAGDGDVEEEEEEEEARADERAADAGIDEGGATRERGGSRGPGGRKRGGPGGLAACVRAGRALTDEEVERELDDLISSEDRAVQAELDADMMRVNEFARLVRSEERRRQQLRQNRPPQQQQPLEIDSSAATTRRLGSHSPAATAAALPSSSFSHMGQRQVPRRQLPSQPVDQSVLRVRSAAENRQWQAELVRAAELALIREQLSECDGIDVDKKLDTEQTVIAKMLQRHAKEEGNVNGVGGAGVQSQQDRQELPESAPVKPSSSSSSAASSSSSSSASSSSLIPSEQKRKEEVKEEVKVEEEPAAVGADRDVLDGRSRRDGRDGVQSLASQAGQAESEGEPVLYCLCQQPFDPHKHMICCDQCNQWFHMACVGLVATQTESFVCPACLAAAKTKDRGSLRATMPEVPTTHSEAANINNNNNSGGSSNNITTKQTNGDDVAVRPSSVLDPATARTLHELHAELIQSSSEPVGPESGGVDSLPPDQVDDSVLSDHTDELAALATRALLAEPKEDREKKEMERGSRLPGDSGSGTQSHPRPQAESHTLSQTQSPPQTQPSSALPLDETATPSRLAALLPPPPLPPPPVPHPPPQSPPRSPPSHPLPTSTASVGTGSQLQQFQQSQTQASPSVSLKPPSSHPVNVAHSTSSSPQSSPAPSSPAPRPRSLADLLSRSAQPALPSQSVLSPAPPSTSPALAQASGAASRSGAGTRAGSGTRTASVTPSAARTVTSVAPVGSASHSSRSSSSVTGSPTQSRSSARHAARPGAPSVTATTARVMGSATQARSSGRGLAGGQGPRVPTQRAAVQPPSVQRPQVAAVTRASSSRFGSAASQSGVVSVSGLGSSPTRLPAPVVAKSAPATRARRGVQV